MGVAVIPPRTCPFDPGYDPFTLESHLEQSAHLMASLKISMACWQIANEKATRRKIFSARQKKVPVCAGGGPFEVAVSLGKLPEYLDLCADIGFDRIEAGEGFTDLTHWKPSEVLRLAQERGLEVQYEVGKKHEGSFDSQNINKHIAIGKKWLDAGAKTIVIEGRENAESVGLFGEDGHLNFQAADQFAKEIGLDYVVFEAPNKKSQFAFLNHFGPLVFISNVRLEELLRVEIYRRGLHSDAFGQDKLRPKSSNSREKEPRVS